MAPVARRSRLNLSALLALSAAATVPKGLVALKAISNAALAEKELPKRLKLLNWGVNETVKGPVKVGDETVRSLAVNQASQGYDFVALDYNHNSLPGHPNYQKDPREVAAYGAVEVIKEDGLYFTGIVYTPSGQEKAANYRDLSPTPLLNKEGEVIFLHSVALCPQGAVKDLSFYSAGTAGLKALDPVDPPPTTATTMDYKTLLCAILGVDPKTATDDDIASKAHEMAKGSKGDDEDDDEEDDDDDDTPPPPKKGKGAKGKPTAMSTRLDAVERELVVANGLREGKVIPLAVRSLPVDQLRTIIAQLPAGTVPTDRQTAALVALTPPGAAAEAAADETVRKTLGISKETWDKHNK